MRGDSFDRRLVRYPVRVRWRPRVPPEIAVSAVADSQLPTQEVVLFSLVEPRLKRFEKPAGIRHLARRQAADTHRPGKRRQVPVSGLLARDGPRTNQLLPDPLAISSAQHRQGAKGRDITGARM